MSLVNRIKQLCIHQHISLHRLEMTLGFSKSSISKWDVNAPSADKVLKVAEYFHVSVDYLLGRTQFPESVETLLANFGNNPFGALTEREKSQLLQYLAFLRSKSSV